MTPVVAMPSMTDLLADDPLGSLLTFGGLAIAAVATGFALRPALRRLRSIGQAVTIVAIAALLFAFVAAAAATRSMVLDKSQLGAVALALIIAAAFAILLAFTMTRPMAADVERLSAAATRVERGDLTVRTGVIRRDELGHASRAIDQMIERLHVLETERADIEAERNELLRNIGHDLRTPLAALQAAVEALVDGVAPDPDRYLRAMEHDVHALSALIDDVFLLGRLRSGRTVSVAQPVDVVATVEAAIESLTPTAEQRSVAIDVLAAPATVDDGCCAMASPEALSRTVRNLIDNATRHAPPNSTVTVTITRPEGAGTVVVSVDDSGPGFSDEFRDHAFEVSSRADEARNRSSGGTGLGLAIARELVEAHHGKIWIGDGPGGHVHFSLPSTHAA